MSPVCVHNAREENMTSSFGFPTRNTTTRTILKSRPNSSQNLTFTNLLPQRTSQNANTPLSSQRLLRVIAEPRPLQPGQPNGKSNPPPTMKPKKMENQAPPLPGFEPGSSEEISSQR